MNPTDKKYIESTTAAVMCIVRAIYTLGMAIRNNELLDDKGIEADDVWPIR